MWRAWLCWQSVANASLLVDFSDHHENTGKFSRSSRNAGKSSVFPAIWQLVTPTFPMHLNREFLSANRDRFARTSDPLGSNPGLEATYTQHGSIASRSRVNGSSPGVADAVPHGAREATPLPRTPMSAKYRKRNLGSAPLNVPARTRTFRFPGVCI